MLRGIVARGGGRTVVALRTAELVTFTEMDIDHPHALVPVLTAGLTQHPPARFDEFSLPARVGARADEQIRNGAPLADVLEYLGIPASARPVVEAAFGAQTHVCRDRRRAAPRRPPHQHGRRREHRRHPRGPRTGVPVEGVRRRVGVVIHAGNTIRHRRGRRTAHRRPARRPVVPRPLPHPRFRRKNRKTDARQRCNADRPSGRAGRRRRRRAVDRGGTARGVAATGDPARSATPGSSAQTKPPMRQSR